MTDFNKAPGGNDLASVSRKWVGLTVEQYEALNSEIKERYDREPKFSNKDRSRIAKELGLSFDATWDQIFQAQGYLPQPDGTYKEPGK